MATADLIAQTEFRKRFLEVDLIRLVQNFEKISRDYADLDHVKEKAQLSILDLEKGYCDLKIAILRRESRKVSFRS